MPTATCILTGKFALLVDESSGQELKVPTGELRRNALTGCCVAYAPYRQEVPLPEDLDEANEEEEQAASLGSIPLGELWKRPSAQVVEVLTFPEEEFSVFISQINMTGDKKSTRYLLFSGSHNVHLYAMDADNLEVARQIRAFLANDLVEHRLDAKLWSFWAQVHKPEDHEAELPEEYIRIRLLRRVEVPSSYEAAVQAEKAAALLLAAPPVAEAVREPTTPATPAAPAAGVGKWRAIDRKGTEAAEQLFLFDRGAVRYAVALPLALLSRDAKTVSKVLAGIVGQGETLFLGDEKVDLLGAAGVEAACWRAQREPGGRPALVVTLSPECSLDIGTISDMDVTFMSFEETEEELAKCKSAWAKQTAEAARCLDSPCSVPFEEGEEEYALGFDGRTPKVAPPKPVRHVQALLQSIRLKAEEVVATRLRAHREAGFRFIVREVRAPLQCHLDTFFQPPFDAPISALLAGSKQPLAPRAQLRDDQQFTEKHLLALRQRLPRRSEPVRDNAVAYLRDIHLGELLQLCQRSPRFFDPKAPAKDVLRGVEDSVPFDKPCRSAIDFLNQIFLLRTLCSSKQGSPSLGPELAESVAVWYSAVARHLRKSDGLEKLQKTIGRTRAACKSVRALHFHRGMLSAPMACDMYVVGLDSWRLKLKCSLTGVSLSTEVLQPYCRKSLDGWLAVDEQGRRSVTLHFINEPRPTVLRMWDVVPVWVLGVVENGEMGLRVVALCTDAARRTESQGWLPVCSVLTASTWSDFHYYRLHEHRMSYESVEELLDVQFPPYLHKMVADALECSALNQTKSPSQDAIKKMSHRNVVQHPVMFKLDMQSQTSWLKDMNQNSFRFEPEGREPHHPCLRQHARCDYGAKCSWLCYPRDACLEELKGRCADAGCRWQHLSEEAKKEYEQETKWMQFCMHSKGFLGILWFMRPTQGKASKAGRKGGPPEVAGSPAPTVMYAFLQATRWDGLALIATLRHVPRTPMPHFAEAFAALRRLWPKGTVRALVYPLAPIDWARLQTLCPPRTADGGAVDPEAWAAIERAAAPLLLKDPPLKDTAGKHTAASPEAAKARQKIAEQICSHSAFQPFEEQMAFMEAALSEDAPAHLPLMFGVAGTGKTTTLMHTAYLRHLRHPRAVVVYLAHTNQTVEAMHTAVNDAKRTGAFPDLVPERVVALAQQTEDRPYKVKYVDPRCNLLCITVDKFLLESGCWPGALPRISLLIVDEVQSLPDVDLLVLRHRAAQLGTSDFRMVLAGDPSQLKCMLKHAPLQQDLHVDYSRRAVLQWIHARKKKLRVLFPPICLSRISRLADEELLPLTNKVYEGSTYPVTLTCSSSLLGCPPLPAGLERMMALAVEGREERLPDHLRGPGVSPHTFYNRAQCGKALELCQRIAQDPSRAQWKVLLVTLYDGDRIYLTAELERRALGVAVEVEVVEKLGGKQADIVVCVTTRTRKHHGGRPKGLLSWSRNHVVTACTRHRRCFVMIACPGWISDCWVNRLRHVWQFLQLQRQQQRQAQRVGGGPSSPTQSATSTSSYGSSVGTRPSSTSTASSGGAQKLRRGQWRVSRVVEHRCCAFLDTDIYFAYLRFQADPPKENDLVDCLVEPHQGGRNNWRVVRVLSVSS